MSRVALVVDDSMLIRHAVCRYLEERGFAVESATDGQEALELLQTVLPDLIITDLIMPRMDGAEFITRLKAAPHTAKIPIVLLAARSSAGSLEEKRVDFVIYKDIEIESQLSKALVAALGDKAYAD